VNDVLKHLDNALTGKFSKALTIFGPVHEAKVVVDKVLQTISQQMTKSYGRNFSLESKYIARVNGDMVETDDHALAYIANQFLKRSSHEGNMSSAVSDIEVHLRQCRIDKIPSFFIIEHFEIFAKRKRQALLYTLLNFLHHDDFYLIVSLFLHIFFLSLLMSVVFFLFF